MLKIFTCHGGETLLEFSTFVDRVKTLTKESLATILFESLIDEMIGIGVSRVDSHPQRKRANTCISKPSLS